jgi:predicted ester cyclase
MPDEDRPVSGPSAGDELVRRYLEDVFSHGKVSAMDRYLRGEAFMSRVAELVRRWRSAFSDFRIEVGDVIVDRHWVVSVETLSGTHDGVYHSRLGLIEPTGRHVTWSRISIRTLDGDRFVDGFFEEDELGLLDQLGALALDTAAASRGWHSPLSTERRSSGQGDQPPSIRPDASDTGE